MTTTLTLGHHAETRRIVTWGGDVPAPVIQVDGTRHSGRRGLATSLLAEAVEIGMRAIVVTIPARAGAYRLPGVSVIEAETEVSLTALLAATPSTRETVVVVDSVPVADIPTRAADVRVMAVSVPQTIDEAAHLILDSGTTSRDLYRRTTPPDDVTESEGVLLWLEPRRGDMSGLGVIVTGGRSIPLITTAHRPMEDAA